MAGYERRSWPSTAPARLGRSGPTSTAGPARPCGPRRRSGVVRRWRRTSRPGVAGPTARSRGPRRPGRARPRGSPRPWPAPPTAASMATEGCEGAIGVTQSASVFTPAHHERRDDEATGGVRCERKRTERHRTAARAPDLVVDHDPAEVSGHLAGRNRRRAVGDRDHRRDPPSGETDTAPLEQHAVGSGHHEQIDGWGRIVGARVREPPGPRQPQGVDPRRPRRSPRPPSGRCSPPARPAGSPSRSPHPLRPAGGGNKLRDAGGEQRPGDPDEPGVGQLPHHVLGRGQVGHALGRYR